MTELYMTRGIALTTDLAEASRLRAGFAKALRDPSDAVIISSSVTLRLSGHVGAQAVASLLGEIQHHLETGGTVTTYDEAAVARIEELARGIIAKANQRKSESEERKAE